MKPKKFYSFKFSDGYEVYRMGMTSTEKKNIEREHGKLVSKKAI